MSQLSTFEVICEILIGILISRPKQNDKIWNTYEKKINQNLDKFEVEFGTRDISEINKLLVEQAKARLTHI